MVKRKLPLIFVLLSLVGLAFGVGYVTYPLLNPRPEPIAVVEPVVQPPVVETEMPVDVVKTDPADMLLFWEVWHLLDRDFFGEQPGETARRYGAVRGLVEAFGDPYTYFIEPQPRAIEQDALRGSFGGVGAYINRSEEGFRLNPLPGQPADLAGIQVDDLLIRVDEHEIGLEMADDEVVALVRGPLGADVALTVRRNDEDDQAVEETIAVTRAEIETPSIEWRMLDDDPRTASTGYISHSLFTERSPAEMLRALDELYAAGAENVVLDLRGNPGGMLDAAIEIADIWLDGGLILVEERADGTRTEYRAKPGGEAVDLTTVLIVDGASASASEIVAGALLDNGRARLVGERTFGKGSVQLIHQLSDESSLHVTSAEWFTPNGHALSGQGLTPESLVEPGTDPLPVAVELLTGVPVVDSSQTADEGAGEEDTVEEDVVPADG